MIRALDHVTLVSNDVAATETAYRDFFGGLARAGSRFQLANIALVVAAADEGGPGLTSLAFEVADFDDACRLLARRGLGIESDLDTDVRSATASVNGLTIGIVDRPVVAEATPVDDPGAIVGLDHVVVNTTNPDRAVALFGGRLGLDLRLDRTFPDRAARQLFFRCGDLVVEVVTDLNAAVGERSEDSLAGLAWRASEMDAVHARLSSQGMDVSIIRTGRKPGSRVFTIKSPALGVPTLVIGP